MIVGQPVDRPNKRRARDRGGKGEGDRVAPAVAAFQLCGAVDTTTGWICVLSRRHRGPCRRVSPAAVKEWLPAIP